MKESKWGWRRHLVELEELEATLWGLYWAWMGQEIQGTWNPKPLFSCSLTVTRSLSSIYQDWSSKTIFVFYLVPKGKLKRVKRVCFNWKKPFTFVGIVHLCNLCRWVWLDLYFGLFFKMGLYYGFGCFSPGYWERERERERERQHRYN